MRKKPLIRVPKNGDTNGELEFENTYDFVSVHDCSRLDVAKTLITNRIHRYKSLIGGNPVMNGLDPEARVLDHYCLYKTKAGKFYFTAQPYLGEPNKKYMYGKEVYYPVAETIASVSRWCRENGLDLDVRIPGPHNSETTMFIISRIEEEQQG